MTEPNCRPHPLATIAFLAACAASLALWWWPLTNSIRVVAAAAWLPTVVLAATAVSMLRRNGYPTRAAFVAGMYLPVTGLLVYLLLFK
jgi:predicted membrane protein